MPQPLRWRLAMLALILAGLVGIALCGAPEPVGTTTYFWAGG